MGGEFQAVLLEGIFFLGTNPYPDAHGRTRDGFYDLLVQESPSKMARSAYDVLLPLVGQKVQFAAHHVPSLPIDPTRWGAGSCLWQASGSCPFGHHQNPGSLFNVSEQGVLAYDLDHEKGEGGWWIEKFDGGRVMLPLAHALSGHQARIAAATVLSVEEMRAALEEAGGVGSIDALGAKLSDVKDLLERLSKVNREG